MGQISTKGDNQNDRKGREERGERKSVVFTNSELRAVWAFVNLQVKKMIY